jgi:hypothetical protein
MLSGQAMNYECLVLMLVVVAKAESWFLPIEAWCLVLMLVVVANAVGWFFLMEAASVECFFGES